MSVFYNCLKSNRSITESAIDTINGIETLEEGVFTYTPSMVPVAMRETSMGTKYIMEYDMLGKLASGQSMTIVEAYEAICQENGFNSDDAYVLVNGDEMDDIKNAVTQESAYLEAKVEDTLSGINSLIAENVNILSSSSNYLAIEEAVGGKIKFFKIEKVVEEHPELTAIKDDLKDLNYYTNGEKVYAEPQKVINIFKKVIRWLSALNANIFLIIGPVGWLHTLIMKFYIKCVDRSDKEEVKRLFKDMVNAMEKIKKSASPEEAKKIDEQIAKTQKKIDALDEE